MLKSTGRIARCTAIAVVLMAVSILFDGVAISQSEAERPYSEFRKAVDEGEVIEVTIDGDNVTWKDQGINIYTTTKPTEDPTLVQNLRDRGVRINVVAEHENPILYALLNWLPMLLLIGVWIYFMRRYRAARADGQSVAADLQHLAVKLDDTNAHLARIEALLARPPQGSSEKGQNPSLGA